MQKTLLLMLAIAISLMASQLRADESNVAYADDFSSVKGWRGTLTNGEIEIPYEAGTRQIFAFMSDSIVGGKLAISLLEDNKTAGPDGKPGLLALSYVEVPISADYSGFVYDGRKEDPIKLPNFKGNVGEDQLKQVKVSFRYKAVNRDKSSVGAEYNCRFETDVELAYEHRVDFGTLKATPTWQTFERTLSSGTNKYEFLSAVNSSPDAPFRLVWGQQGEVSSYDDGDTLLIDDIKISIIK